VKPNLGNFADPPEWAEILQYFRGSELQNYFTNILEDKVRAVIKPQYVDILPRKMKGTVRESIERVVERDNFDIVCQELELTKLLDREIKQLSGGELQRFACAMICVQDKTVLMFDEPSSYLDVRQRLVAARIIRALRKDDNYIILVEHDLSVLDYMSDSSAACTASLVPTAS